MKQVTGKKYRQKYCGSFLIKTLLATCEEKGMVVKGHKHIYIYTYYVSTYIMPPYSALQHDLGDHSGVTVIVLTS